MVTSVCCLPIYCVLLHHLENESLYLPSSYIANFFSFSFLTFRVALACVWFTTAFVLPWALISPSLLFGGRCPVRFWLPDSGCWQQSEGGRGVVLWGCLCWCAGTSKIKPKDVAGWLQGECNGTGRKSKAAEVSVRQRVYSQQMRALEIPRCVTAGGSRPVRLRAVFFSYWLPISLGLYCCRRAVFPTTVQCF